MQESDPNARTRPLLQQAASFRERSRSTPDSEPPQHRNMLGNVGRAYTFASVDEKSLKQYAETHERIGFAGMGRIISHSDIIDVAPRLASLVKRTNTMAGLLLAPEPTKVEDPDDTELQTNGEAIVNLLNNCLGSGMLTMGFAFAKAGILPSIATMLLSSFLNRYTLLLNLDSCKLAQCDAASAALGEAAYGRAGRIGLVLIYSTFSFLCCVSYVTATADALTGILALFFGDCSGTSGLGFRTCAQTTHARMRTDHPRSLLSGDCSSTAPSFACLLAPFIRACRLPACPSSARPCCARRA